MSNYMEYTVFFLKLKWNMLSYINHSETCFPIEQSLMDGLRQCLKDFSLF